MKKNFLSAFLLLSTLLFTPVIAACGDDDEPVKNETPNQNQNQNQNQNGNQNQNQDTNPAPTPAPSENTPSNGDGVDMLLLNTRVVGMDISMLPTYELQGAQYKDADGTAVSNVLAFLKSQGFNAMRVRLFVDPARGQQDVSDGSSTQVVQDLAYVKSLARRIKQAGFYFLLDFHYSDSWADPSKQWTPAAWLSLTDAQLEQKVYDYTKDCLQQLTDAGAAPDYIQTGNEISYGMLWGAKDTQANRCFTNSDDASWNRFTRLLKQAGRACREVCPKAPVILHSERVEKPNVLIDFFNRMERAEVDYNIIGLSYYPYFHGSLESLQAAVNQLSASRPTKKIHIVETGYAYKWAVGGTTFDYSNVYPLTAEGGKQFTLDLIKKLKNFDAVNGLYWWHGEANAFGCKGTMSEGWYNASLFDNSTGKALPALSTMKTFLED